MYTLSCESTVDLNLPHLVKRNVPAIAYTYIVDGVEYTDDMRAGNGLAIFYNQLTAGKKPTTSLINLERYLEFFRSLLQKGDLLHVAFGSGLSQSASNALAAAEQLKSEFPNRKIYVVDSLCACVGYGLFVDSIADLRDEGASIDKAYEWAMENRHNVQHQFFSTTLTYFRRSGRISGPAAVIGNLLKLCPIMHLNGDGKIIAYAKVMSETKAITKTLEEIASKIKDGAEYTGKLWIGHSDYINCATKIVAELKKSYPKSDIRVFDIGPVVASHCGPGTLATFFVGARRS
ncbi:MAG: DegV family protein [Clostridiales bacterium]|nr:DegV family protein [Clostridiales bacterium]